MSDLNLTTIQSPGGAKFTVAGEHADRFSGLVKDLEAAGYPIKGEQSGGYNDRNIAGTNTPSKHATGAAIDVNWNDNPRGAQGQIDPDVARSVAARHGLTWGGDWKNPDPMHFEVPNNAGPYQPPQDGGQTAPDGTSAVPVTSMAANADTTQNASPDATSGKNGSTDNQTPTLTLDQVKSMLAKMTPDQQPAQPSEKPEDAGFLTMPRIAPTQLKPVPLNINLAGLRAALARRA